MTSIYRTAYPYFHKHKKLLPQELIAYYSLSADELNYIKKQIRGDQLRLGFAVQLKVFQQLNYFPELKLIPHEIIDHIKKQIPFINETTTVDYQHDSALRRHRSKIYELLKVTPWMKQNNQVAGNPSNPARYYAIQTALQAAKIMNHPADIINVVIEALRKNHYEFPSFSQLSQLDLATFF